MPSRYFFTETAGRIFQAGGRNYQFEPTDTIGVRLVGVLEAATPEDVANLLSLVGRGVVEIPLQDFELEKKRTRPAASASSSSSRPATMPVLPSRDFNAPPAPAVKPDPDQAVRVISLASVLKTGPVNSPRGSVGADERVSH